MGYSLNTNQTSEGIICTIPLSPTDDLSGKIFAQIHYRSISDQKDKLGAWKVEIAYDFPGAAFLDGHTFHSREAAEYLVLAAYIEHRTAIR